MTKLSRIYSRIGDNRVVAPFAARPLSLWLMLSLWPDEHDRKLLKSVQTYVRTHSVTQPHVTPKQRVLSVDERQSAAIKLLAYRYWQTSQYEARHLFAAAAHRKARLLGVTRPFDMCAAWAGLVKKRFESTNPDPYLLSILGATEIDGLIMDGGEAAAEGIASHTLSAIIEAYPDSLQSIATDESTTAS